MADSSQTLASGSLTMFLSMSSAGVLSVLTSLIVARWLGVSDFGLYSLIVSLQGVVGIVAGSSVGTAVAKYISQYKRNDEETARSFAKAGVLAVLVLSSAVALVYVTLSGLIGRGLYNESRMVELIPFSALVVMSSALYATFVGIVQGCQKIRLLALMQVSYPLLNIAMVVPLLSVAGMRGVFLAYSISQSAVSVVAFTALHKGGFKFRHASVHFHRGSPIYSKLFSFAFPAVLGSLMVVPTIWTGNTELTLRSGLDAMGFFGAAFVIYQSLIVIPTALAIPMMPKISELSSTDRAGVEALGSRVMRILAVILFPAFFAMALFGGFVIETLYGSRYAEAAEVLYLMVAASYFYALSSVVGTILAGTGRMWLGLGLNALWAVVFVIIVFIAVPSLGMNGLGLSYAVSYTFLLVFMMLTARKTVHLRFRESYVPAGSAALLFTFGFLLASDVVSSGLLYEIAFFAAGVAFFVLIGHREFANVLERVMNRHKG